MPRSVPEEPYKSAFDLPSFKKMMQDLKAARLLGLLAGREVREKFAEVERGYRFIGETVDNFYTILGPRNWVFHDRLSPEKVGLLLADASPEEAERLFIQLHKDEDWLPFWAKRVARSPDLSPWGHMIQRAVDDYLAGRYYSTTMLLLAVMDGYVNNVDKSQRRGLHAQDPEDMKSWDSVTGHHMGLTHVMPVIFKTIRAPITGPVTEVYRNGIMHGSVVDFDNDVVATKAWNYFFAVLDWAADKKKQAEPEMTQPTVRQLFTKLADTGQQKRALADFSPRTLTPKSASWSSDALVLAVTQFFESWQVKNYGRLAESLQAASRKRLGKTAPRRMRELFGSNPISGFSIESVSFEAAAIGVVSATVTAESGSATISMRWVSESGAGDVRVAGTDGAAWRRVFDGCPI
ncbi:hypothetical protein [Blastococcus sp. TF02A-35]|uniref:hypothetical protein n=1 Tax=Blastococcus sp. TF02A-35 TaxID=2559612 RepID=UPI001073BD40|nr:hypothetical protein [Blastococcus sp. TF02A_35]TFV44879.1 hypothetical protein E4P43_18240 [Blastococcus sp. TF02A_35]